MIRPPLNYCVAMLLLLVICWAGSPVAAGSLDDGRRSLAAGEYDTAYRVFDRAFRQNPADPELNFLLGRAAFESSRYEEAVMAYERVLISNPNATRAKLELARTYARLGSNQLARQYFNEVLATNPPEAVWRNIQLFLVAIDSAEKRHFVNGMFTVAVGHDDNVRAVPGDVYVPALDLTFSTDRTRNTPLHTTLVLNHIYRGQPSSPNSWKTTFSNHNALHDSANDMDLNFYGLSTGPVRRTANYLLQAGLLGNHIDLGSDRYLGIVGLSLGGARIFSEHFSLNAALALQKRNFYQDSGKDSSNIAFNAGPVWSKGTNRVGLTLGYEKESADEDLNNSYQRYSLALRYDRSLPRGFDAFISYKRERNNYEGLDPAFNNLERRDDRDYWQLGAAKTLWRTSDQRRSLIGQATYGHTRSSSNIDLYEYKKNVYTLAVTYVF